VKPSMKIFLALNSGEFEKIKYRQSWAAFLIFFDTKTSEAKPSECAIRSQEAKPSVTKRA